MLVYPVGCLLSHRAGGMALYCWRGKELLEIRQLEKFMGLRRGKDLHLYLHLEEYLRTWRYTCPRL